MPEKDPTNWSAAMWALASGSAIAGGVINWYQKLRSGNKKCSITEFFIEVAVSALIGIGVFMSAASAGMEAGYCAALAGVGGKMSTSLLALIESAVKLKFKEKNGR